MPANTGQAIREELLEHGILLLLGTMVGTAAANYISDTARLQSAALPATRYDDCWVRLTSGTGDGEISKVDYLDPDNGRLYVSPSFTGVPTGTYEISRPGVEPDDIDRARDEALTRYCSQWAVQPITELLNGDWEDTLGSTWSASSSALAIQGNIGPPQELFRNVLRVTNSGANGRAASTSIYPRPSQHFYIYVPVSARSGNATLIVRDVTNSANISLTGTATMTGRGWTGIEVTGQIPSTCYEMQVWLSGNEADAIIDWGPICFHWQGQTRVALPSRIDSFAHIGRIYYKLNYAQVGVTDEWGMEQRIDVPSVGREYVLDGVALQFPDDHWMRDLPYYYQERIFYDALSSAYLTAANRTTGDAATTLCPVDYVAAATLRVLAEWYAHKQPDQEDYWVRVGQDAQAWLDKFERRYGPKVQPVRTRERTISIPYVRV